MSEYMYLLIYSCVKPFPLLMVPVLFHCFLELWWGKSRDGRKEDKKKEEKGKQALTQLEKYEFFPNLPLDQSA